MSMFPRVANEFTIIKANAMAENSQQIEQFHDAAEDANRLFAFSHAVLAATTRDVFAESQHRAFIYGVRAYEVIALGEMSPEEHARYSTAYVFSILSQIEHDGNFDLHFLEDAERSLGDMQRDVPQLAQAVELLASAEMHDPSTELGHFALYGAATIRDGQLEVDQLLEFENMFES